MTKEKLVEIFFSDLKDKAKLRIMGKKTPIKKKDFEEAIEEFYSKTNFFYIAII